MEKTITRSKWLLLLFFLLLSLLANMLTASTVEKESSEMFYEVEESELFEEPKVFKEPEQNPKSHISSKMLEYEHSELSQEKEEMDLAKLYNQAFSSYKGEVNYEPVQLINEKGHFMTISNKQGANKKTSEQTMNGLMGAIQGIDNNEYKVISIFGPQSSGKSYLMNQVFGTGFEIKDRDVNQKTRGVWLARSSVVKDLLVIDCEGTGGSERTEQEGIEKQMAERGMLFSLLVSQIVIFNIDKAQLNTEADRAILTNIVNYYMDNRKTGCPPLRMIISVRNVDSRIRLTEVNRLANGIVEEAYHKNQRKTKEKLNEIFEIEVFWFGNFDYEGDNPYKHLKYTLEEHSENDEILGVIGPLFPDRLKLFQKRFTNPGHSRYFLKGLIPIVDISGLPLYLHQFWNIVRDVEGVSITNVLDLVFEQQVKYVTEQLTKNYKEMWNDLIKEIKNEDSESSERISERVSDYVKLKHKESTESLEKSVPNYGHSEALKEANNYLLGMLSEIDAKLIKHLMANLAETAANSLQGKIESLLSDNTHKQEADALKLIDKTIKSIQLIDSKKDIKSWASSLLELQKDTADKVKEQQRNRMTEAVHEGVRAMSDHKGDFVEKVQELAKEIAESEGVENEEGRVTALESEIAKTWNTQVTSASRKARVKKVFTDRYEFKKHVVNADHIDNIRNEANAEKDRLVNFRKHFDRIGFQDTADAWDKEMNDVIEHEHTTKKTNRDAHVLKMSSSIQTQSLKTALAVISILYFLSDPSIMFGIFLFFFYLIAANGMLSEKLLHIGEWIGFVRQFMSFSGIIMMVINAIRGAVVPLIASS